MPNSVSSSIKTNISSLPSEVLILIFGKVDVSDIIAITRVSKNWHALVNEPWINKKEDDFKPLKSIIYIFNQLLLQYKWIKEKKILSISSEETKKIINLMENVINFLKACLLKKAAPFEGNLIFSKERKVSLFLFFLNEKFKEKFIEKLSLIDLEICSYIKNKKESDFIFLVKQLYLCEKIYNYFVKHIANYVFTEAKKLIQPERKFWSQELGEFKIQEGLDATDMIILCLRQKTLLNLTEETRKLVKVNDKSSIYDPLEISMKVSDHGLSIQFSQRNNLQDYLEKTLGFKWKDFFEEISKKLWGLLVRKGYYKDKEDSSCEDSNYKTNAQYKKETNAKEDVRKEGDASHEESLKLPTAEESEKELSGVLRIGIFKDFLKQTSTELDETKINISKKSFKTGLMKFSK